VWKLTFPLHARELTGPSPRASNALSYLLFADDNEDMRRMVRSLLESAGHEVELVPDGSAALKSIQQREPDLLILDLAMPGMTGFDVCHTVKANPFTARIPVLMLTGETEIEAKVAGFEAGADDYLAKPFDPRELRARVSALLRLVRREADRNPTSGLPGGRAIEEEIALRVARRQRFAVCYLDLDNFKAFADTFGFTLCDQVIRDMGGALRAASASVGAQGDFVGHIGGDDFIIVTTEDKGEEVAEESARKFRDVITRAVGEDVAAAGHFVGRDRDGVLKRFPLAGVSSAVLIVDPARWVSMTHLGAAAAEMKRLAKARGDGTILAGAV
jgi:diguanylate cyclase (GGDEF)-like protein